jgi:hypothetical protein
MTNRHPLFWGYCPGDCHLAWHADESETEVFPAGAFDVGSVTEAMLILFATLDDHYSAPLPYCANISINGNPAVTVPLDGVPHGEPFGSDFTNFTLFTWALPPTQVAQLVSGDNTFSYSLGCTSEPGDWIAVEWSELVIVIPGCY